MSIYNKAPNGSNLPKNTEQSVYNKMLEGYIPPPRKVKSPHGITKMGSVVEITLGDEKLIVHDPARLEGIIQLVEKHEESMYSIRQTVKQLRTVLTKQDAELKTLKSEVQRLKEILNGNNGNYL